MVKERVSGQKPRNDSPTSKPTKVCRKISPSIQRPNQLNICPVYTNEPAEIQRKSKRHLL